ncbi:hypothetical protein MCOR25_010052 [Pyricularia grisea]|uniref:GAR domain-containing protein n=1 Tax=Pyricularia grisea TaxID=148305 RepID=A0A6P8BD58_PYRGI|nr:uncharacterized protein PgNI_03365 [Pyricularia grisea]KAI6351255.1 hypothetical protein MCOR25_010052 [Pyricularia grisea]TLD13689.1 hypothetical protein PgNI_03365 [Pyricularia grisea]
MGEAHLFHQPTGRLLGSSRHHASSSISSIGQRATDDLLSSMTPSTALDAFRNPTGALKKCLDSATATEQAFALGAAIASKNIYDWLTELSEWTWPTDKDGSSGFDSTASRGRQKRDSHHDDVAEESRADEKDGIVGHKAWLGCLQTSEVLHYEQRLASIQAELDDMDIEGIKRHVLYNHILPLSRPGTPMSARSAASTGSTASFYNKMDDITALVTATVVQTLPNLSRLVRLMSSWRVRLLVLRRVPMTLKLLDDAEIALRSGWNVIDADINKKSSSTATVEDEAAIPQRSTLLRHDFEVMKSVLGQKTAQAGSAIDFMLDQLDGRPETVPSEWIDRMDGLEKGYGDWIAVCEKMMADAELAKTIRPRPSIQALDQTPEATAKRPTSSASTMTTLITSHEQTETPPLPKAQSRNNRVAEISPPSSPPSMSRHERARSTSFTEIPPLLEEDESILEGTPPKSPLEPSLLEDSEPETPQQLPHIRPDHADELQQKISSILGSIPAKIHLSSQPNPINHLNPPDLQLPHLNTKSSRHFDRSSTPRSQSRSQSAMSARSSRAGTPAFLLAPAFARTTRSRLQRDIQVYHLSRESTGEPPIKLFIRLVGENGDRCMVRVGGGWADLGEYLKEYAIHHGRRSKGSSASKVEVKDIPTSSPGNRPASALDSPITPLHVRKTRRSFGGMEDSASSARQAFQPKTPLSVLSVDSTAHADNQSHQITPPSESSTRSRSSSRLSWAEEDSLLGMSGPTGKQIELDAERKEWIENVKEKVRIASGERRLPPTSGGSPGENFFGEINKVGGTKRLFRRGNQ